MCHNVPLGYLRALGLTFAAKTSHNHFGLCYDGHLIQEPEQPYCSGTALGRAQAWLAVHAPNNHMGCVIF